MLCFYFLVVAYLSSPKVIWKVMIPAIGIFTCPKSLTGVFETLRFSSYKPMFLKVFQYKISIEAPVSTKILWTE